MNAFHVLVVCALLGVTADDPQAEQKLGELLSAHHWAVAPEFSWFRYEEPGLMDEEGTLYGVSVSYTRYYDAVIADRILKLEGGFATGEVDYDGGLQDGTPYTMEGNDDMLINARVLWGPLWHTNTWANYFHFGLGYRYLQDDSTQDPLGYKRHSNYFYLPLGVKASRPLGGNWYAEFGGELDLLIVGLQVSEIPRSSFDPSDVENWQWPGVGIRGSVELRHKSDLLDVAVAPFVQYWWVDESRPVPSDPGYYWIEPRNWSIQAGVNLLIRF